MDSDFQHHYSEDELLPLSGIQHYKFCPRQWALIHIEQLWEDNSLTMEGSLLHENVDNPFVRETKGTDVLTLRGVRLVSPRLGLTGIADAIEIKPDSDAPKGKRALIQSKKYTVLPVEYKRGKRKINDCDRVQVAAQSMILEDILDVRIDVAAVFYREERHREYVEITQPLRDSVLTLVEEMHELAKRGITPSTNRKKSDCRACSLKDLCMPSVCTKNVNQYLLNNLDETFA